MAPKEKGKYAVRFVEWNSDEAEALKRIRFSVFVDEQKVPAELELDSTDAVALHVLAENSSGEACGTGRLFDDPDDASRGKIGRMAVLESCRGSGCGGAILVALMSEAVRKGYKEVTLSAQLHAVPFYQGFGFELVGALYDDAGIPHQTMVLRLA